VRQSLVERMSKHQVSPHRMGNTPRCIRHNDVVHRKRGVILESELANLTISAWREQTDVTHFPVLAAQVGPDNTIGMNPCRGGFKALSWH
jgi:hypothetical protein